MKKIGLGILFVAICLNTNVLAQGFYSHWAKQIGGSNTDVGRCVVVDPTGAVLTTGYFSGTVDFDPGPGVFSLTSAGNLDIFISKLDAGGNFIWARRFGGASDDIGRSIAIDLNGNVYTCGDFQGTVDFDPGNGTQNLISAGLSDIFVSKLDPDGNFIWAKKMGGTQNDVGAHLVVDASQHVHTTGWFSGTADFNPGPASYNLVSNGDVNSYISKLDVSGNFIWAKQIPATFYSYSLAMALDKNGNVFTSGFFAGGADFDPGNGIFNLLVSNVQDAYVWKLDASGNFQWAKQLPSTGTSSYIGAISLDAGNNVYLGGAFNFSTDFDPGLGEYYLSSNGGVDAFVLKLDPIGNFLWAKKWGAGGSDICNSIQIDGNGHVYTVGHFSNTVDFDPGPGTTNITSFGAEDIYISKLDNSGEFIWTKQLGGASTDISYSLAIDPINSIHITGSFLNTADFDPGSTVNSLSSSGLSDVFIAKFGQVTLEVEPGNTPENLVRESLVGNDCFDITNVSYSGNPNQIGLFSNGLTNIGITDGIILATGDIGLAPGPNDQNGAGSGGFGGADTDLQGIATNALFDVAVLEFDITPTQPNLTLDYIFASEEYCEYVNSAFSDVFGIFISGPGIIGAQNMAIVPAANAPISINTVNHITNSGLYVHNTPPTLNNCETGGATGNLPPAPPATGQATQELQYDGFTQQLSATAQVIPCSTYHIKMAIADVGDGSYDSAVFLKAGSLKAGGNTSVQWLVNGDPALNQVVEGCGSAEILVSRAGPNLANQQAEFITISGTATSGDDFEPFSTIVFFDFGQDQVIIPFNLTDDMIPEGTETVILNLSKPCSCQNANQTLEILDYVPMIALGDTVAICRPDTAYLGVQVSGGAPPYSFNWSNGSTNPINTVIVNNSASYSVTVTDACGTSRTAIASVQVLPVSSAQIITPAPKLCSGQPASIVINLSGPGPFILSYSRNGVTQPPVTDISGSQFVLLVDQIGTYSLVSLTDVNGCMGVVSGVAVVTASNLALSGVSTHPTCANQNTGSINTTVSGGQSPYNYTWQGPIAIGNIADPFNLPAGNYFVTVSDGGGCTSAQGFTITSPPALNMSLIVVCDDVTISASGGTGALMYRVDGLNFQTGNQFLNLSSGTHTFTVRDANGCTSSLQTTIAPALQFSTQTVQPLCHDSNNGKITVSASGGTPPYTFSLNNGPGQSTGVFNNLPPGTYNLVIQDNNGCNVSSNNIVLNNPTSLLILATVTQNTILVQASGGTGFLTYSINGINFQASNQFLNVPNGTYTVTVKDGNGCTATTQATVAVLTATVQASEVLCAGNLAQVTIMAGGGTPPYQYQLGNGPFQSGNQFFNLGASTYVFRVKDAIGAVFTIQHTIVEPPTLQFSVSVNCNDGVLNISGGTPPYTFTTLPDPSSSLQNLPNGVYQVTVTDNNGCTASNFFSVQVDPLDYTFQTDSVECFGGNSGSITVDGLGGCPPYRYSFNGSPFLLNNTFSNLTFGTYSLTVRDDNGVLESGTITVFQPVLLSLTALVTGNSIQAFASGGVLPYSYRLNGGQPQNNGLFPNLSSGNYTVTVTDGNGCVAQVQNLTVTVGTDDPVTKWGVVVSPNPSSGLFHVTFQHAPESIFARVFDMTGKLIQSFEVQPGNETFTTPVDLSELPGGAYLLFLSDGISSGSFLLNKTRG